MSQSHNPHGVTFRGFSFLRKFRHRQPSHYLIPILISVDPGRSTKHVTCNTMVKLLGLEGTKSQAVTRNM